MTRLRARLDEHAPDWELAAVLGRINMYYLTGTMQDGMLLIPRGGAAVLWVRRSVERALDESLFPDIRPMDSFRDAAAGMGTLPSAVYLEMETVPLALFARLQKYFPFREARALDAHMLSVRSIKSAYELEMTRRSGEIHRKVLEERVPALLREGVSEADFAARLYAALVEEGHHGAARFGMFGMEIALGQIGFGENALYPSSFNGPGGGRGLGPAAPILGDRGRKLRRGDLVFVDVGCGYEGYHTDKTMTYVYGGAIPGEAAEAHRRCVEMQNGIAAMLVPGAIPSQIYRSVMAGVDEAFLPGFMGYGTRRVKFLGHGVGLQIDETPVLAEGFDEPLREGMVMALEPKKGIGGVGMVGIENTFLIAPGGGECITGDHPGLMKL
jgi:Xaa-Pro aminopeptidase